MGTIARAATGLRAARERIHVRAGRQPGPAGIRSLLGTGEGGIMSDNQIVGAIDRLTEAVAAQAEVLRTLNDNVARLVAAQIASSHESYYDRRDAYDLALRDLEVDEGDGLPVIINRSVADAAEGKTR